MTTRAEQPGFYRMSLVALAAVFALAYQWRFAARDEGGQSWAGSVVKTLSTALLVAAGWAADAPLLIVIGLALGAVGDFALSRPGTASFLAGMAAFAAGHLAYIWAFWTLAATLGFTLPSPLQTALLIGLAAIILPLGLWLSSKAGPLRLPVLGYTLIIGLMAAAALILPPHPGGFATWAGVTLFLLSDTLLALRLFVATAPGPKHLLGLAVWPAYWLGQALILTGSLPYWAFAKG